MAQSNEPSIEQMNLTIARFMGMEGSDDFIRQNYQYHKSWQSLMPVVEKIEKLENRRFGFTIDATHVVITDYKGKCMEIIWVHEYPDNGDTKISMTYDAVYQFIQWYNQQASVGRLGQLFAEADQACENLKELFNGMKGRKICSNCGIDYDENEPHNCH